MQFISLIADNHGMAGVGTTLVAHHDVEMFGEQINELAFRLVTPLQTNDTSARHVLTLSKIH